MTEETVERQVACMTVGELRRALVGLSDSLPVRLEVTFGDGADFEGADLHLARVESRCDEVEALYLWGDQES
jgi:hypothetical protein